MSGLAREGDLPTEVCAWRTSELIEAGYPEEEAFVLGNRLDIDLHEACELLRKGCPLKFAIRILT